MGWSIASDDKVLFSLIWENKNKLQLYQIGKKVEFGVWKIFQKKQIYFIHVFSFLQQCRFFAGAF